MTNLASFLAIVTVSLNLKYFFSKYFSNEQIGLITLFMCTSTLLNFRASINLTLTSVKYPK